MEIGARGQPGQHAAKHAAEGREPAIGSAIIHFPHMVARNAAAFAHLRKIATQKAVQVSAFCRIGMCRK